LKNKTEIFLILSFATLLMELAGCWGGGSTTNTASTTDAAITSQKFDEKAILKETQAFIKQFTKDLSEGNTEAVLKQLDPSTRLQIGDSLDLSSPGAKKLSEAISTAKSTQVNLNIVFYESRIDEEAMSFYIIKEAGHWKFGGL
jgi:hypothetical protein